MPCNHSCQRCGKDWQHNVGEGKCFLIHTARCRECTAARRPVANRNLTAQERQWCNECSGAS